MRDTAEICTEIAYLAHTYLDLERWGFQEKERSSELSGSRTPAVIYDSDLCKVRVSFSEWHPPHQSKEYAIDVYYGRLSAPNDKNTGLYNNEECHCWHGFVKVLHFIDNSSPSFTAKNLFSHDQIKQFGALVSSKSLTYGPPEWEIRKHSYIWDRYAPRLFEVFDLRHPELWEQYRQFLKEVYDIKGRSPLINPPMDKVC